MRIALTIEQLEARRLLATDLAPVLDINTDPNSFSSYPSSFTTVGPTLYFTASTDATGVELWKSDGTTAGTVLVKDIFDGQIKRLSIVASECQWPAVLCGR